MRRVIDGKAFDTKTAENLAEATSPHNPGDFHKWTETLYRTPKGAYFLEGEGGALSSWAVPVPGGSGGGADLRLLGLDEAQAWVERYANEEYEGIFGAAEEA